MTGADTSNVHKGHFGDTLCFYAINDFYRIGPGIILIKVLKESSPFWLPREFENIKTLLLVNIG